MTLGVEEVAAPDSVDTRPRRLSREAQPLLAAFSQLGKLRFLDGARVVAE